MRSSSQFRVSAVALCLFVACTSSRKRSEEQEPEPEPEPVQSEIVEAPTQPRPSAAPVLPEPERAPEIQQTPLEPDPSPSPVPPDSLEMPENQEIPIVDSPNAVGFVVPLLGAETVDFVPVDGPVAHLRAGKRVDYLDDNAMVGMGETSMAEVIHDGREGKVVNAMLATPGRLANGPDGWAVFAAIEACGDLCHTSVWLLKNERRVLKIVDDVRPDTIPVVWLEGAVAVGTQSLDIVDLSKQSVSHFENFAAPALGPGGQLFARGSCASGTDAVFVLPREGDATRVWVHPNGAHRPACDTSDDEAFDVDPDPSHPVSFGADGWTVKVQGDYADPRGSGSWSIDLRELSDEIDAERFLWSQPRSREHRCELEVRFPVGDPVEGTGEGGSEEEAKKQAWSKACAEFRRKFEVECTSENAFVSKSFVDNSWSFGSGAKSEHTTTVTFSLAMGKTARGTGSSRESHEAACEAAEKAACDSALGKACDGVKGRRMSVDGKPTENPWPW